MTDVVVHLSSAALRGRRFAALLGRSLHRAMVARDTRRALDELPDNLLRDIGLTRSDIPFIANALASGGRDPTHDALGRLNRTVAKRGAVAHGLPHGVLRLVLVAVIAVSTFVIFSHANLAQDAQIERGTYHSRH